MPTQVIDIEPGTGRKIPRYLIYDMMALFGQPVGLTKALNRRLALAEEVCGLGGVGSRRAVVMAVSWALVGSLRP